MSLMMFQEAGKWTTPYGPNVRYTVRFHIVGVKVRPGTARPVDYFVEYRVVTPIGKLHAVARATIHFAEVEVDSIFLEVDVSSIEHEFTTEPDDLLTDESRGR